jgi:hypothetical protein
VLLGFVAYHVYSGRRSGKSWSEIGRVLLQEARFDIDGAIVNSADPQRDRRLKRFSLALFISGIVFLACSSPGPAGSIHCHETATLRVVRRG